MVYELIPQSINGNLTRGGVEATCFVEGKSDAINAGDIVVLRGKSLSGFADTDERIVFRGFTLGQPAPVTIDTYTSRVQVRLGTSDSLLRGEAIQAIAFSEQATPANAHQFAPPMKIAQCFHHCIEKHSNHIDDGAITVQVIDYNGSTQRDVFIVPANDNFWSAMQRIGGGESNGEFFRPWLDRENTLYYQKSPAFWTTPPASIGTLDKATIIGQPRVQIRNSAPGQITGQVQLATVRNATTTYVANYPASPNAGKTVRTLRGVWSSSQADTNQKAQDLYRWLTRPYTMTVDVDPGLLLFGDDGRGLRLADAVQVVYNGPAENTETGAGIHLNINNKFYVYGYNVRFDTLNKMANATLTLEADN